MASYPGPIIAERREGKHMKSGEGPLTSAAADAALRPCIGAQFGCVWRSLW